MVFRFEKPHAQVTDPMTIHECRLGLHSFVDEAASLVAADCTNVGLQDTQINTVQAHHLKCMADDRPCRHCADPMPARAGGPNPDVVRRAAVTLIQVGKAGIADSLLAPLDDPVAAVTLGLQPTVCFLLGETAGTSAFVPGEATQEVPVEPRIHPTSSILGAHGAKNQRSIAQGR